MCQKYTRKNPELKDHVSYISLVWLLISEKVIFKVKRFHIKSSEQKKKTENKNEAERKNKVRKCEDRRNMAADWQIEASL